MQKLKTSQIVTTAVAVVLMGTTCFAAGEKIRVPLDKVQGLHAVPDSYSDGSALLRVQETVIPTGRPVSFSEELSKDGKKSFGKYCKECHGADLNDGEFGGPNPLLN